MPANFSSMVGEFMAAAIPKYCKTIVRNKYHNGHPVSVAQRASILSDSILHAPDGIEVKASRHKSGWQGHNAEDVWLMVFVFDSNTSRDAGLEELSRDRFDLSKWSERNARVAKIGRFPVGRQRAAAPSQRASLECGFEKDGSKLDLSGSRTDSSAVARLRQSDQSVGTSTAAQAGNGSAWPVSK